MREVVINIKCDGCTDDLTEDTAILVSCEVLGMKYEADICNGCLSDWISPMRLVPAKRKSSTPKTNPGEGTFKCDECGKKFTAPSSLRRHVGQSHPKEKS